jgi:hypothetical protein
MKMVTVKPLVRARKKRLSLDWFDPLESGVRRRIRGFIEELLGAELAAALGRDRYKRPRRAETGSAVRRSWELAPGTAIARAG